MEILDHYEVIIKIIKNPNNTIEHKESIENLIENFKLRWIEEDPKETYELVSELYKILKSV